VTYEDLLSRWGEELPAWEASFQLDPSVEKFVANAAWQLAASKGKHTIYEADFYATERPGPQVPAQTEEDADKEAMKLNATWPRTTNPKSEIRNPKQIQNPKSK
jgi:hypothetical protein